MKEERLITLKECLNEIQNSHKELQEVHDEEEEAFDNLPEGLQDSERGDSMQDAIDSLDEVVGFLDDVISGLEDVISTADDPNVLEIEPWQKLKKGDVVTHKSYGRGKIQKIEGKTFYIEFSVKTAKFNFPDAIDGGFITL